MLQKLVHARIVCSNSISELGCLLGLADQFEFLDTSAIEIRLQCEFCATEAGAILDILTILLSDEVAVQEWLWAEMELRQGHAVMAAEQIMALTVKLASTAKVPERGRLALKQMEFRIHHILTKLKGLRASFAEVAAEVQASSLDRNDHLTPSAHEHAAEKQK